MSDARLPSSVAAFDALPDYEASPLLESCCGASAWVRGMIARRPFESLHEMLRVGDDIWWSLEPEEWREAFDHHPRIGERSASVEQGDQARGWSASEQGGADLASGDVRAALAAGNREYERRFGHIYLVCATGKTADEMLAILKERLTNDAWTEMRVAAGEQAKITRLRLLKMFDPSTT